MFSVLVALSLVLVLQSGTSVVSSRVIIAHIVWTRKRLESQVIVTTVIVLTRINSSVFTTQHTQRGVREVIDRVSRRFLRANWQGVPGRWDNAWSGSQTSSDIAWTVCLLYASAPIAHTAHVTFKVAGVMDPILSVPIAGGQRQQSDVSWPRSGVAHGERSRAVDADSRFVVLAGVD